MCFGCVAPLHELSHSIGPLCPFMDLVHPNEPVRPSNTTSLALACPILGCTPLSLCRSSWLSVGVPMGSSNLSGAPILPRENRSTTWVCSQAAPSFPKRNPCLCHSLQGKKGVCPFRFACYHHALRWLLPMPTRQILSQLMTSSLCSSLNSSLNLPKECACLVGVTQCIFFVNTF